MPRRWRSARCGERLRRQRRVPVARRHVPFPRFCNAGSDAGADSRADQRRRVYRVTSARDDPDPTGGVTCRGPRRAELAGRQRRPCRGGIDGAGLRVMSLLAVTAVVSKCHSPPRPPTGSPTLPQEHKGFAPPNALFVFLQCARRDDERLMEKTGLLRSGPLLRISDVSPPTQRCHHYLIARPPAGGMR